MKTLKEMQDRFNTLLEILEIQGNDLVSIGLDSEEIKSVLHYLEAANFDLIMKKIKRGAWIPVEEYLPGSDEMVLVTCKTKKGVRSVNRAYYEDGFWHGSGSMSGVIAWSYMPEPYEEEEHE